MSFLKNLFKKEEDKPIKDYQDFWNWFLENEKKFHKVVQKGGTDNITTNFFDVIAPKLDQLKEGIWYLTGMLDDNTSDLILTADGNLGNFYLIEELIASAPKIEGWKFRAHKPEHDIENATINMVDFSFSKKNIFFYSDDLEEYPDEINITIVHDDFSEELENEIVNGCYIFLDNYLGELDSLTVIDNIDFKSKEDAEKELIPIEKLKPFLDWREKEFVEKYQGIKRDTENDSYISFEATLKNGNNLLAVINSNLLSWEAKASHPWILRLEIAYDGEHNNGFPDDKTYVFLNEIEDELNTKLKDFEGYLNVGRETSGSLREVYFACKDFRKPCKVLDQTINNYSDKIKMNYEIYKDKYWRTFDRYQS